MLLLRGLEFCEQYSTVQHVLCLCSPKKWSTYTHRRFNETLRIEFHFAFQRGGFARLLATTVAGSHAHQKRKRKMLTVNAQSKRSLSQVFVWLETSFKTMA